MKWCLILGILSFLNLAVAFHGKFDWFNLFAGMWSGYIFLIALEYELEK